MPFHSIILGHVQNHNVQLVKTIPDHYDCDFISKHVKHQILIVSQCDYEKYKTQFYDITFIVFDRVQVENENVFCFDTLQSCLNHAAHIHPEKKIFILENNGSTTFYNEPACSDVYLIHLADSFPFAVTDPFHLDKMIPTEHLNLSGTFVPIPNAYEWSLHQTIKKNNQEEITHFQRRKALNE